jgi:hypothetical protein
MEFFKIVDIQTTEAQIRKTVTLTNLEKMSTQLISLGDPESRKLAIGSVWGEFTLSRDEIRGGLRFALVECPNALAWTITTGYPPAPEKVILHLTINRLEQKAELIEELEEFLEDVCTNLKKLDFKTIIDQPEISV